MINDVDPMVALRHRFFASIPSDRDRAARPAQSWTYDERLAAAVAEHKAIIAALKKASGKAAEMLEPARVEAARRVKAIKALPQRFGAECISAYEQGLAELDTEQERLRVAEPECVAAYLVSIEAAKARVRKAIREGEALMNEFDSFRKPVFPALASAVASLERERSLADEVERLRAARSPDVAALVESLQ